MTARMLIAIIAEPDYITLRHLQLTTVERQRGGDVLDPVETTLYQRGAHISHLFGVTLALATLTLTI